MGSNSCSAAIWLLCITYNMHTCMQAQKKASQWVAAPHALGFQFPTKAAIEIETSNAPPAPHYRAKLGRVCECVAL